MEIKSDQAECLGTGFFMKFLPADFVIPTATVKGQFKLIPLSMDSLATDPAALLGSKEYLRNCGNMFPPDSVHPWPRPLNLRQHLALLALDEVGLMSLTRLGYCFMSPNETKQFGCLYIWTPSKVGYDADVLMWMSEEMSHLDDQYWKWSRSFISANFPFRRIACPGREIGWDEWARLKDRLMPIAAFNEMLFNISAPFSNFPPSAPSTFAGNAKDLNG